MLHHGHSLVSIFEGIDPDSAPRPDHTANGRPAVSTGQSRGQNTFSWPSQKNPSRKSSQKPTWTCNILASGKNTSVSTPVQSIIHVVRLRWDRLETVPSPAPMSSNSRAIVIKRGFPAHLDREVDSTGADECLIARKVVNDIVGARLSARHQLLKFPNRKRTSHARLFLARSRSKNLTVIEPCSVSSKERQQ